MVGPRKGGSSGRIAMVFILILVLVIISYIVSSPTSQVTGTLSKNSISTNLSTASSTTFPNQKQTTTSISSETTGRTTLPRPLVLAGGRGGQLGGPFPKEGDFTASLNSSEYAELLWNATGDINVYLYNTTGGLMVSKTGLPSGNYTFCAPGTGDYEVKFEDSDVLLSAPIIQANLSVYGVPGSTCSY
jgi:hypothetical protein